MFNSIAILVVIDRFLLVTVLIQDLKSPKTIGLRATSPDLGVPKYAGAIAD